MSLVPLTFIDESGREFDFNEGILALDEQEDFQRPDRVRNVTYAELLDRGDDELGVMGVQYLNTFFKSGLSIFLMRGWVYAPFAIEGTNEVQLRKLFSADVAEGVQEHQLFRKPRKWKGQVEKTLHLWAPPRTDLQDSPEPKFLIDTAPGNRLVVTQVRWNGVHITQTSETRFEAQPPIAAALPPPLVAAGADPPHDNDEEIPAPQVVAPPAEANQPMPRADAPPAPPADAANEEEDANQPVDVQPAPAVPGVGGGLAIPRAQSDEDADGDADGREGATPGDDYDYVHDHDHDDSEEDDEFASFVLPTRPSRSATASLRTVSGDDDDDIDSRSTASSRDGAADDDDDRKMAAKPSARQVQNSRSAAASSHGSSTVGEIDLVNASDDRVAVDPLRLEDKVEFVLMVKPTVKRRPYPFAVRRMMVEQPSSARSPEPRFAVNPNWFKEIFVRDVLPSLVCLHHDDLPKDVDPFNFDCDEAHVFFYLPDDGNGQEPQPVSLLEHLSGSECVNGQQIYVYVKGISKLSSLFCGARGGTAFVDSPLPSTGPEEMTPQPGRRRSSTYASSPSSVTSPEAASASWTGDDDEGDDDNHHDDVHYGSDDQYGDDERTVELNPSAHRLPNSRSTEAARASGTADGGTGFWYSSLLPGIDVEGMFRMLCDGAKSIERDPETLEEEYTPLPFDLPLETATRIFEVAATRCKLDGAHRKVQAPANVGSDFHGQITSLIAAHTYDNEGRKEKKKPFIGLGDYGERGHNSWWIWCYIALFKIMYPDLIFLIRGNHETEQCDVSKKETSLLEESKDRFGLKKGYLWFDALHEFFRSFQYAITLTASDDVQGVNPLILTHGGFPQNPQYRVLRTWNEVTVGDRENDLRDAMWSDPCESHEGDGFITSPRGPLSKRYGRRELRKFLNANSAQRLIRGHGGPDDGCEEIWDGEVVTIESSTSRRNDGCFLCVDADLDWSTKYVMEEWYKP